MTLVEATCCIRRRTVTLWVPMANSPSRLAAATLMASGSESGAPINTTRKKAVRTAHSKPNIHGRGVRPRRSSLTAMTVVIMPATRKIGIANTFVSTSCSCRIAAAAVSTKLPVTCATNNPNQRQYCEAVDEPGGEAQEWRNNGWGAAPRRKQELAHGGCIPFDWVHKDRLSPAQAPINFDKRIQDYSNLPERRSGA